MSTVRETHFPTASTVADVECLLQMRHLKVSRTQHVKDVNSTIADVKCTSSLTRITGIVVGDTYRKAAYRLKTGRSIKNVSPATLLDTISVIPFVINDAFGDLVSQPLSNTTFPPDTTLKGLMKRLINERARDGLRCAQFQSFLHTTLGDVHQFETCTL